MVRDTPGVPIPRPPDPPVQEINGVANCIKVTALAEEAGQDVIVRDEGNCIRLGLRGTTFPALLTPAEARHLAKVLTEAAIRAERHR